MSDFYTGKLWKIQSQSFAGLGTDFGKVNRNEAQR